MSERISDVAEKLSTPAALTTSATTATAGYFSLNELAVLVGILGTLLTVGMTWYFNHRRMKMEQAEHDARMKQYEINAKN